MDYFGIRTPQRDNETPYIWWIANSRHEAWMSFFQYPSAKGGMNAHRLPLAEAIRAYEAIGYRCVAVDVQEKPNQGATDAVSTPMPADSLGGDVTRAPTDERQGSGQSDVGIGAFIRTGGPKP